MSEVDEYKEAASQHRLQNTLIFGQLAVFLFATGTMAKLFPMEPKTNILSVVIPFIGIIFAISFFTITHKASYFSHMAVERARKLEEVLGYELFSNYKAPKPTLFSATNAVKLIYIAIALGWVGALLWVK